MTSFSKRHGYSGQEAPITVREDAPMALRHAILQIAAEQRLEGPSKQRELICRVLRVLPDGNNWSEYPNVASEVEGLITTCKWYRVYDIAEALYAEIERKHDPFSDDDTGDAREFEAELNEFFFEHGIGWKMEGGQVSYRGARPFERTMAAARDALEATNRTTAQAEVVHALENLGRRPSPDRTGAIQHSLAALECVMRDVAKDPKETVGPLMKNHAERLGIPKPLDVALEKLWGYASEMGRHLREGREPSAEEAELVATLSAAVVTYLIRKQDPASGA